jgi:hypothetical protein
MFHDVRGAAGSRLARVRVPEMAIATIIRHSIGDVKSIVDGS